MIRGNAAKGATPVGKRLRDGRHHVLIEGLPDRAGFLRTIEDGNGAHGRRQRRDEVAHTEGAEQLDGEYPDPCARAERIDHGFGRFAPRAHHDDDALGVRRSVILEQTGTRGRSAPANRSIACRTIPGVAM